MPRVSIPGWCNRGCHGIGCLSEACASAALRRKRPAWTHGASGGCRWDVQGHDAVSMLPEHAVTTFPRASQYVPTSRFPNRYCRLAEGVSNQLPHLTSVNPYVSASLGSAGGATTHLPRQIGAGASPDAAAPRGGISGFAFQGTNAHVVLARCRRCPSAEMAVCPCAYLSSPKPTLATCPHVA
jgi:hypothetical protein